MRHVLACVLLCLLPVPSAAQSLPQIASIDTLRPLESADAARGWEAVGRLDTGVSFCSATLVAPDLVLTAAHCLFDGQNNRIADAALRFAAGLRNGQAEAVRQVARAHLPAAYHAEAGPPDMAMIAQDIALLELAAPIHSGIVVPMRTGLAGRISDAVTLVSYGRDRESHASIQEDCTILGRADVVTALTCSVVPGSSGAPILRQTPTGFEVVAVVSAMGEWGGVDAAFGVDVTAVLPELMAAVRPVHASRPSLDAATRLRQVAGDGGRSQLGARFVRP